jgi:hypothetical protein
MEYNVQDFRVERWNGYKQYYQSMMFSGDCDPAYPAMNYLCDRLELNMEQRYWLAYLYGITYSAPSAYYIFQEFPDYENVDVPRLQRWWDTHKKQVLFQSDRLKVKNFNMVIKMFESYRTLMGDSQQASYKVAYDKYLQSNTSRHPSTPTLYSAYDAAYGHARQLYYFGRFSLFNYLEAVTQLSDYKMDATNLYLQEAESCRNGLCYASSMDKQITVHHTISEEKIDYRQLDLMLCKMKKELERENPELPVSFFNLETVLCAYKKLFWKTRYLGYYIDRLQEEIQKMEQSVPAGVDWSILWDFRREYFQPRWLGEIGGWKGIRKERSNIVMDAGKLLLADEPAVTPKYMRKVEFGKIGEIYG